MNLFLKSLLLFFLVALLFTGCKTDKGTPVAKIPLKPNIIYIMADDLGYGDLGCYGQKEIKTPHIDRLAEEGIRFTQHYAGSTVCAPSRCSLMTGLHTGHTVVRGNKPTPPMGQYPLPDSTVTVAKILKDAGYHTALIGKWGLGGPESNGHPLNQGFDYFFGYLCQRHAHNYYPEFLFRDRERVPLKNVLPEPKNSTGSGVAVKKVEYSHDLFAKDALKYIREHKDDRFFLYFALTIPHANDEAHNNGMEVPDYGIYVDKDWPEPQKGLAAMITRMDRDVGRIMDLLKETGIDDKTLVIFTSDNGPHAEGGNDPYFFDSDGPFRGFKRDLYEGGIRVPLIARWPGKIAPGTKTGHVSAFWDFMPTVCELTGENTPKNIDGISYLPVLLGKTQPEHNQMYWEFHEQGGKQAVLLGTNWKGIRLNVFNNPNGPIALYNLDADPGELHNVAGSHHDIVSAIERLMIEDHTEDPEWPFFDR